MPADPGKTIDETDDSKLTFDELDLKYGAWRVAKNAQGKVVACGLGVKVAPDGGTLSRYPTVQSAIVDAMGAYYKGLNA